MAGGAAAPSLPARPAALNPQRLAVPGPADAFARIGRFDRAGPSMSYLRLQLQYPAEDVQLAKPNYAFQKRQREAAKKQKKEEKQKRKQEERGPEGTDAATSPQPDSSQG